MYLQRVKAMEAARIGWRDLVRPNLGAVFLYMLMRIVVAIGIGVATQAATCLTCCIAGLPYIGRVILLPLFVFEQSYTLYFIEQFGPQWRVFVHDEGRCPACGYDVRYSQSSVCPECGSTLPWRSVDSDGAPPVAPDA
jgi:hypothetical protein